MNLEKIKQVFCEIKIPNEFGGNYEEEDYIWVFEWIENNILSKLNEKYYIAHGVSKIVLIPKEKNYVIKIPFNGTYNSTYNKEGDIIEESWEEFMYAPEECGWDYCATEVEVYNKAKEKNIECFFAKTEYLCSTKNHHPIYIQEKVNTRYSNLANNIKPSNKSLKDYKEKCNCHNYEGILDDNNWMAICVEQYGIEKTNNFIEFILEEMPFINTDLHSDNYGFRTNKMPCLIDFSDWCEYD